MFGAFVDADPAFRLAGKVADIAPVGPVDNVQVILLFKIVDRFWVQVTSRLPRVPLLTVTFPPDLIVSGLWLPPASDNLFDFEFFAPAASTCVR